MKYIRFLYKYALHLRACFASKQGDIEALNRFAAELNGPLRTKVKDWASAFDLSFLFTSLGELYLTPAINNPEYAEGCFKKSIEYNPHFPFAHHQLWLLYQRQNKSEQAAVHFHELEKIWKNADPEWKAIYMPQQAKK
jgi:tetratricopeptide (TPR) repeat protein